MLKQKIKILITCAGGILVRSLVQNLQRSTFFDYEIYGADTSKNILHPKTKVISGIMADKCSKLLTDFFKQKR